MKSKGDYVITLLFTSAKLEVRKGLPNRAFFAGGTRAGLTKDCVVQAESIAPTYVDELDLVSVP